MQHNVTDLDDDLLAVRYQEIVFHYGLVFKVLLDGESYIGRAAVLGFLHVVEGSAFHKHRGIVAAHGAVNRGHHTSTRCAKTGIGVVMERNQHAVVELHSLVERQPAFWKVTDVVGSASDRNFIAHNLHRVAVTVALDRIGCIADGERGIAAVGEVGVDTVHALLGEGLAVAIAFDSNSIELGVGAVGKGNAVDRVEPVEVAGTIGGGGATIVD